MQGGQACVYQKLSYIPGGPGLTSDFFFRLELHGMKAEYIPSVQQDSILDASIVKPGF